MGFEHSPQDLKERIESWLARARTDDRLYVAAKGLHLEVEVSLSVTSFSQTLRIVNDPVGDVHRVALEAPAVVWEQVLADMPPPGYHSFTALRRSIAEFRIEAKPLVLAQSLAAVERFFELARPHTSVSPQAWPASLGAVQGGYHELQSRGARAVVYHERAGEGPPLVFLHTAGADSRQYLPLMSDPWMQSQWRMHAFDLPFHGRSLPTESWNGTAYTLTQEDYLGWCLAFVEHVVGEPAAVMGCSMGGAICIALAARASPWVQGVIALEAPDRSPGRLDPHLFHPAVNQAVHNPAYVRGLMSPSSPQRMKDLACWYYAQGGPGVYPGDLGFYSTEYDGAELAKHIDTDQCPVFLLTGEYDYSASPAATKRLARLIPGAYFEVLKGLGHFPMTENPEAFRCAAEPVLTRLHKWMTERRGE